MSQKSTILIGKNTISLLKKAKDHPRQTYDEVLRKMAKLYHYAKKRSEYDEFLHRIQQEKMQELWDNEEDEAWERA